MQKPRSAAMVAALPLEASKRIELFAEMTNRLMGPNAAGPRGAALLPQISPTC